MTWVQHHVRVGDGFELYDLLRRLVGSTVTDLNVSIGDVPWVQGLSRESLLQEVSITDEGWVMVTILTPHIDGSAPTWEVDEVLEMFDEGTKRHAELNDGSGCAQ